VAVFELLVAGHVIAGTLALVSFWAPVILKKGSPGHIRSGRIFAWSLTVAALLACSMGILNLTLSNTRHPTLVDRAMFDGLFGWMMLYLGLLSLLLVTYGMATISARRRRIDIRNWRGIAALVVVALAALQCGVQGVRLGQPLMIALSVLGLITVGTFARTALFTQPSSQGWIGEHLKAMIAAGISAYTAFLSVGLLRVFPEHVFNPLIWSVPSVVGVMLIIHHLRVTVRH
jgi:hypothetical protein